jgi:hypothetical protein
MVPVIDYLASSGLGLEIKVNRLHQQLPQLQDDVCNFALHGVTLTINSRALFCSSYAQAGVQISLPASAGCKHARVPLRAVVC